MRHYRSVEEQLRDLLRQSEEENNRQWNMGVKWQAERDAAREETDRLAYDYSELADTLCRTDDLLAETEDKLEAEKALGFDIFCSMLEQRDEAREIAGELFAYLRALALSLGVLPAWERIRPGVRRMLK